MLRPRHIVLLVALAGLACQEYPFEFREAKRAAAQKIDEVIATVRPTDILFVIDDSGTMDEERKQLKANLSLFIDGLLNSSTDFQVGIITTDFECNRPDLVCSGATPNASLDCCAARKNGTIKCQDKATNADGSGDGKLDWTNCDVGRLRSATGLNRIFRRPAAGTALADKDAWLVDFSAAITVLDCNCRATPAIGGVPCTGAVGQDRPDGSAYEAGLATAFRAVACGVNCEDPTLSAACADPKTACPDTAVAQLNQGFVRTDADLVVIFVTDEDDCSFLDLATYETATSLNTAAEQAKHLCTAMECYAYYGATNKAPSGRLAWTDSYFKCSGVARKADPPMPENVTTYLDAFIALKGGDPTRVRAAGILAGLKDPASPLGFRSRACYEAGDPSDVCGCLSTASDPFFCDFTRIFGQASTHLPPGGGTAIMCGSANPVLGGCESMPGGRYAEFLRQLAERRVAAGVRADTLVDSICQAKYDETLKSIVNNIILTNCFDLEKVPAALSDLRVSRNGKALPNVEPGSALEGWSWTVGSKQVCLEHLSKTLNDKYEIFLLSSSSQSTPEAP